RRLAFLLRRRENFHRAAGLLDRRHRRLGGAVDLDIDLGLDLAAPQEPHTILGSAQHARLHERFRVDHGARINLLGVYRLLQPIEIDLDKFEREGVAEAALRKPAMQRHLAAFKTLDAHTRTRGLTLAAASRLLALAGADAAADAHALFTRTRII